MITLIKRLLKQDDTIRIPVEDMPVVLGYQERTTQRLGLEIESEVTAPKAVQFTRAYNGEKEIWFGSGGRYYRQPYESTIAAAQEGR